MMSLRTPVLFLLLLTSLLAGCAAPDQPSPPGNDTPPGDGQGPPGDEGGEAPQPTWNAWTLDQPVHDIDGQAVGTIAGYTYEVHRSDTMATTGPDAEDDHATFNLTWAVDATVVETAVREARVVLSSYNDDGSTESRNVTVEDRVHVIDHRLTVLEDDRGVADHPNATVELFLPSDRPEGEAAALFQMLLFDRFAYEAGQNQGLWEFGSNESLEEKRRQGELLVGPYTEGDDPTEWWGWDRLLRLYGLNVWRPLIAVGLSEDPTGTFERTETTVELGGHTFKAYNITMTPPRGGSMSMVLAPELPMPVVVHSRGNGDGGIDLQHHELTGLSLSG